MYLSFVLWLGYHKVYWRSHFYLFSRHFKLYLKCYTFSSLMYTNIATQWWWCSLKANFVKSHNVTFVKSKRNNLLNTSLIKKKSYDAKRSTNVTILFILAKGWCTRTKKEKLCSLTLRSNLFFSLSLHFSREIKQPN